MNAFASGSSNWVCGRRPRLIKCAPHICSKTFHLQLSTFHRKKPKAFSTPRTFNFIGTSHYLVAISFLTASVNSGKILKTSPTTPKSATLKIGAVSSLLIAMITSDSSIPAKCWIAPEIPQAMYRFGRTVLPVWPT